MRPRSDGVCSNEDSSAATEDPRRDARPASTSPPSHPDSSISHCRSRSAKSLFLCQNAFPTVKQVRSTVERDQRALVRDAPRHVVDAEVDDGCAVEFELTLHSPRRSPRASKRTPPGRRTTARLPWYAGSPPTHPNDARVARASCRGSCPGASAPGGCRSTGSRRGRGAMELVRDGGRSGAVPDPSARPSATACRGVSPRPRPSDGVRWAEVLGRRHRRAADRRRARGREPACRRAVPRDSVRRARGRRTARWVGRPPRSDALRTNSAGQDSADG